MAWQQSKRMASKKMSKCGMEIIERIEKWALLAKRRRIDFLEM